MKKFKNVLLASDFDDTLYAGDGTVSQENLDAIEYFTANGGYFTVATGRSRRTFLAHAMHLPLNAPAVVSNGAAIHDFSTDRVVEENVLPPRAVKDCEVLAAQFPTLAFETYHGELAYAYRPNLITEGHADRVGVKPLEIPLAEMPQPLIKIILEDYNRVLGQVQRFVQEHWSEHYEAIFSNRVLLELTVKGCTKGGAMLRLARMLGVEREHLYCVGDNQNDLSMLAVSNIGFCPRNAVPEVRASGARVVASCDDHCVRDVIEILDGLY